MAINIRQVDANNNADLLNLIEKLDQYLFERYPADEVFVIDFTDSSSISDTIFMIAYDDERPVGCGAIRPIESNVIELKRFYVEPEYRKQGIAGKILNQLEEKGRDLNYSILRLEAGEQQPEAIHFYKKHGYYEIERYGEYVNCESSLCFEKQLGNVPSA
ncbi:GNAT family N-acetyltransferase [Cohnella abietis]|uniref:N-acetyltransferase n=1 Tax=Cohnella abietis TaxID=2507935 RepID=A0A3T1D8S3_9BACL|nr:GNAT family N-acetyltransferase [Cohnella abietis]BBI34497.1 N-acetyltransferase [Cohnella abietis]